jgi:hypothetical protein
MILQPINNDWVCPASNADINDVLKNIFEFNNINFIQTDIAGASIDTDPYSFFAVNRVLLFRPVVLNQVNKYSNASYECLLTIARAVSPSLEVETGSVDGQFDTITKEFLNIAFLNTLRSYFKCCGYEVTISQVRPIWNSTSAVKSVNHSGVEINLTVEI